MRLIDRKYVLMPLTNGGPQSLVSLRAAAARPHDRRAHVAEHHGAEGPGKNPRQIGTKMSSSGIHTQGIKPRTRCLFATRH